MHRIFQATVIVALSTLTFDAAALVAPRPVTRPAQPPVVIPKRVVPGPIQPERPTDAQVEKCIAALQAKLMSMQVKHWTVWSKQLQAQPAPMLGPDGKPIVGKDGKPVMQHGRGVDGEVTARDERGVTFKAKDGRTKDLTWEEIEVLLGPGHIEPELLTGLQQGGHTAMAMWALVASGLNLEAAANQEMLMGYVNSSPMRGTYCASFRLNTLSYIVQWARRKELVAAAKDALKREADIMVKAMSASGNYGYGSYPPPGYKRGSKPWEWLGAPAKGFGDHSNTQFGVFAVWAAEDGAVEVPPAYWELVDEHWRSTQGPSGGWAYHGGPARPMVARPGAPVAPGAKDGSSLTMTDAGMNSLYLVVDKLWSRQVDRNPGFQRLKGFKYEAKAAQNMAQTFATLEKGWGWYKPQNLVGRGGHGHYGTYGLQRLGLASGRKYIAGRSWFEEVVKDCYIDPASPAFNAARQMPVQEIAWRLMCLAFGRAPVFMNKLAHGQEQDWNYYFRDVANLMDWLNHAFDSKRHNWQIVTLKDELYDLQDAPVLLISGEGKLDFKDEEIAKLRKYCDLGGTVLLHPTHASEVFKGNAMALFQKMYEAEGYKFVPVPKDHGIYTANGIPQQGDPMLTLGFRGMSDGGRFFAILCEGDISSAWQLKMDKTQEDMFKVMFNLRLMVAFDYADLPGRLRPKPGPVPADAKKMVVARVKTGPVTTGDRLMYEALAPDLAEEKFAVVLRDSAGASDIAGASIIHISGMGNPAIDAAVVAAIKAEVAKGAFIVIDPVYGDKAFLQNAPNLVKDLGLTEGRLNVRTDPLTAGDFKLNRTAKRTAGLDNCLRDLRLNGQRVGVMALVDISGSATGQPLWDVPALSTATAQQLWVNIVKAQAQPKAPVGQPATAPAAP